MCLSTVYYNRKEDDCVAFRYVAKIGVEGDKLTLTDVMGMESTITGKLILADLTGGTVIIQTDDNAGV